MTGTNDSGRPSRLGILPAYVLVLAMTAAATVVAGHHTQEALRHGREVGSVPADARRELAFALLFTWAVAVALVVAWLGELLATPVRIARGDGFFRSTLRLVVAVAPLAILVAGQCLLDPRLVRFVRDAARSVLPGRAP